MPAEKYVTNGIDSRAIYSQNPDGVIPFMKFMELTGQKDACAAVLGKAIRRHLRSQQPPPVEPLQVLDIGAGNAYLLNKTTEVINEGHQFECHLLEPNRDLVTPMWPNIVEMQGRGIEVKIIPSVWDGHRVTKGRYNIVLCSHAYDIPTSENLKMVEALQEEGQLLFVRRTEDDIYRLMQEVAPVTGREPDPKMLLDNVISSFSIYAPTKVDIAMRFEESNSVLNFPAPDEDPVAYRAVMEFIHVRPYDQLTPQLVEATLQYVQDKNWQLHLQERILIITRLGEAGTGPVAVPDIQ